MFTNTTLRFPPPVASPDCVQTIRDQFVSGSSLVILVQGSGGAGCGTTQKAPPVGLIAGVVVAGVLVLVLLVVLVGYYMFYRRSRFSRVFDATHSEHRYHAL
jgi:hypothetical protein